MAVGVKMYKQSRRGHRDSWHRVSARENGGVYHAALQSSRGRVRCFEAIPGRYGRKLGHTAPASDVNVGFSPPMATMRMRRQAKLRAVKPFKCERGTVLFRVICGLVQLVG